jgi:hypothetical protein
MTDKNRIEKDLEPPKYVVPPFENSEYIITSTGTFNGLPLSIETKNDQNHQSITSFTVKDTRDNFESVIVNKSIIEEYGLNTPDMYIWYTFMSIIVLSILFRNKILKK